MKNVEDCSSQEDAALTWSWVGRVPCVLSASTWSRGAFMVGWERGGRKQVMGEMLQTLTALAKF